MNALSLSGITKRYPGVAALTDVSFAVRSGSCHAICGENGAGKSTLGRIISGLVQPDHGTVSLDGTPVRFGSAREALASGVAMVHQELAFCDNLTVGENLCLGALPRRFGFVQRRAVADRARELLAQVGADHMDPWRPMHALSIAEQQLVQIAAGVAAGARVIVFDEPTSSLGVSESERLFALIHSLRARGITILYISHRMPEIHRLCDEITVLRDGRHVATEPAATLDDAALVRLMIGRDVPESIVGPAPGRGAEERLRADHLSRAGAFEDVSFTLAAGEIVGLAGLVGAGRSEVAQAIFGLAPITGGRIFVREREVRIRSARDAIQAGIGLVPEDRKLQGLVLCMRAGENTTLPTLSQFSRWGWLRRARERSAITGLFGRLGIRAAPSAAALTLSGGNQQKLVMAKWLATGSDVLLLDEPTRGVDVGAKAELHSWIAERAASGCAVLLISSELPELLALAHRVIVLRRGRVAGELPRHAATQDAVLRLMAGVSASATAEPGTSPPSAAPALR